MVEKFHITKSRLKNRGEMHSSLKATLVNTALLCTPSKSIDPFFLLLQQELKSPFSHRFFNRCRAWGKSECSPFHPNKLQVHFLVSNQVLLWKGENDIKGSNPKWCALQGQGQQFTFSSSSWYTEWRKSNRVPFCNLKFYVSPKLRKFLLTTPHQDTAAVSRLESPECDLSWKEANPININLKTSFEGDCNYVEYRKTKSSFSLTYQG
jgi:hypothetical protein